MNDAIGTVSRPRARERARGATRRVRGNFEEDFLRCVADLGAASDALDPQPGTPERARPAEVLERLGRLEASVHETLERIDEHLRQEAFMLAGNFADELKGAAHSARARRELAAANTTLQEEITERERLDREFRRLERGLRDLRQLFESAFHHAPIGMAILGVDGRWLQVNEAMCRITGYRGAELASRSLREITHPEDAATTPDPASLLAGEVSSYRVEKRYRHAGGHDVWVLETASVVRDDEFKPAHLVVLVQDVTEQKRMATHIEYLADHDFLSGLCNRRCFERALARETLRSARYGVPGAVLLIDLDHFKDVNDALGHRAGDTVIRRVAAVLERRLRRTDILARMGGDEFAVILPETPAEQVTRVAEGLVRAIAAETVVLAGRPIRITASAGVATFDGRTDVEMLGCADAALYQAKARGRNCCSAASPSPQHRLAPRSE